MKEIKLTNGMVALVDDEDYEQLNKYKWHAMKAGNRGLFYVTRMQAIEMPHQILGLCVDYRQIIDHINRNLLDNRKSNLRIVTPSQAQMHRRKIMGFSSQYKGVYWAKSDEKWRAHIKKNGLSYYLGRFDNEIDAACAYDEAAKKLFGEYSRLNFDD